VKTETLLLEVTTPILSVRNLVVEYQTRRGGCCAVDGISFDILPNEVFGLAGESGSGKSTLAHSITRLIKPPGHVVGGKIKFMEFDLLNMDAESLRDFRWRHISIVSQAAMNALNPVMTVGAQIMDVILAHEEVSKEKAYQRALELLHLVGIDKKRISSYPHQLSGGMRQRAVIAIALALNPELIILDEPTTALDVVVQRQILEQIQLLQEQFRFSILYITHDLSLLVEFAHRIAIMYAGEIVEIAPSAQIFKNPKHPYTVRLMRSFPAISGPRQELLSIPGSPPDLITPPPGCRFHPRCDVAIAGLCEQVNPRLLPITAERYAACHLLEEEAAHAHE
jgi:peptide/nickel transport system ATP-binding protein